MAIIIKKTPDGDTYKDKIYTFSIENTGEDSGKTFNCYNSKIEWFMINEITKIAKSIGFGDSIMLIFDENKKYTLRVEIYNYTGQNWKGGDFYGGNFYGNFSKGTFHYGKLNNTCTITKNI